VRTTLTLDDDVAAELDRYRRAAGITHRQAVNEIIRRGLTAGPRPRGTFVTKPITSGPLLIGIDDVQAVLSLIEGDDRPS
jgi:hypothetical protein